jgi:hypothetical protein
MLGNVKSIDYYEKEISDIDHVFEALNLRVRDLKREMEDNDIPRSVIAKSDYFKLAVDLEHIRKIGLSSEDLVDLVIRDQCRKRHNAR